MTRMEKKPNGNTKLGAISSQRESLAFEKAFSASLLPENRRLNFYAWLSKMTGIYAQASRAYESAETKKQQKKKLEKAFDIARKFAEVFADRSLQQLLVSNALADALK